MDNKPGYVTHLLGYEEKRFQRSLRMKTEPGNKKYDTNVHLQDTFPCNSPVDRPLKTEYFAIKEEIPTEEEDMLQHSSKNMCNFTEHDSAPVKTEIETMDWKTKPCKINTAEFREGFVKVELVFDKTENTTGSDKLSSASSGSAATNNRQTRDDCEAPVTSGWLEASVPNSDSSTPTADSSTPSVNSVTPTSDLSTTSADPSTMSADSTTTSADSATTSEDLSTITVSSRGHGSNVKKIHQCDICAKSYRSQSGLKYHMMFHTGEKPYQCHICGARIRRNLNEHFRNVHSSYYSHECQICSAVFNKKSNRDRHVLTHQRQDRKHGKDGTRSKDQTVTKPYECTVCGRCYINKDGLGRHEQSHHTEKQKHKCDQCGQIFTQSGSLLIHSRKHTGEKPYKCVVCGKRFHRKDLVKNHAKVHANDTRPIRFKCDTCGVGFFLRSQLLIHATEHTGASLYKCHICDKAYALKGSLLTHMKSHTEIWKCHVCQKVLATKSSLKIHLRARHGIDNQQSGWDFYVQSQTTYA